MPKKVQLTVWKTRYGLFLSEAKARAAEGKRKPRKK